MNDTEIKKYLEDTMKEVSNKIMIIEDQWILANYQRKTGRVWEIPKSKHQVEDFVVQKIADSPNLALQKSTLLYKGKMCSSLTFRVDNGKIHYQVENDDGFKDEGVLT